MAVEPGNGFTTAIPLVGPFASGAPAIFIDQVGKLGTPCAIVSRVGDDDFGRLNIDRLRADGVDVSGIEIAPGETTGSAFVRYREDGSRSFVYNIRHSACGNLRPTAASEALIDACDHLHVMGTALSAPGIWARWSMAARRASRRAAAPISFDPNLRAEILDAPGLREALEAVLANDRPVHAVRRGAVSVRPPRRGRPSPRCWRAASAGHCRQARRRRAPACSNRGCASMSAPLTVQEIDPTGAGDSFGGAFSASGWRVPIREQALRYANAAGARAVTQLGPMEGTSTRAELDALLIGQKG
jgi:sugar/nucleoside kinase (ribokinase family)